MTDKGLETGFSLNSWWTLSQIHLAYVPTLPVYLLSMVFVVVSWFQDEGCLLGLRSRYFEPDWMLDRRPWSSSDGHGSLLLCKIATFSCVSI